MTAALIDGKAFAAGLRARVGAEVLGMSLPDFAALTSANFDRLFTKAAQPGARG